jgi:hypothetical protein
MSIALMEGNASVINIFIRQNLHNRVSFQARSLLSPSSYILGVGPVKVRSLHKTFLSLIVAIYITAAVGAALRNSRSLEEESAY